MATKKHGGIVCYLHVSFVSEHVAINFIVFVSYLFSRTVKLHVISFDALILFYEKVDCC